eukprot:scaffold2767_cov177-Amphora_coffeaeformis.AAC.38
MKEDCQVENGNPFRKNRSDVFTNYTVRDDSIGWKSKNEFADECFRYVSSLFRHFCLLATRNEVIGVPTKEPTTSIIV